jgi:hypothetical protein
MMYHKMNEIFTIFANFINFLNVSCYQAQFTHQHEQARARLEALYSEISKSPQVPPTLEQCISFYNDIRVLEKVTDTDDPDYHVYKRFLRTYIAETTPE